MYSLKTDLVTKPSRMVICAMIGCSNRSGCDKVRFFRLPKIVSDRGEQMLSVTMQWQLAWLKAISRDDLTKDKLVNVFVCERHFIKGMCQACCTCSYICN